LASNGAHVEQRKREEEEEEEVKDEGRREDMQASPF